MCGTQEQCFEEAVIVLKRISETLSYIETAQTSIARDFGNYNLDKYLIWLIIIAVVFVITICAKVIKIGVKYFPRGRGFHVWQTESQYPRNHLLDP